MFDSLGLEEQQTFEYPVTDSPEYAITHQSKSRLQLLGFFATSCGSDVELTRLICFIELDSRAQTLAS